MDNEQPVVPINNRTIEGAKEIIRTTFEAAKELNDVLKEDDVVPVAAGMLAYGALFTACCNQLNVPVATGMYLVQELMTQAASNAIH